MVTLLGVLSLILAACGDSSDDASTSTAAQSGGETYEIAVFSPIQKISFLQAWSDGAEDSASRLGSKATVFDANGDAAQQVSQIRTAVASGKYDGLVVAPLGPGVVPALRLAQSKGLKIVCSITVCGDDPAAFENLLPDLVTTQGAVSVVKEQEYAAQAAGMACEGIESCEVAYIPPTLVDPRTPLRISSYKEAIKRYPNIKLVASEQSGNDDITTSFKVGSDLLTKYPDLDVFSCNSDLSAQGIEKAVVKAGKTDQIKVIGGDGSELGIEKVKSGVWYADAFPEKPYTYGALITEALIDALNGETAPEFIDDTATPEEGVLTKENVDQFRPEWSGK